VLRYRRTGASLAPLLKVQNARRGKRVWWQEGKSIKRRGVALISAYGVSNGACAVQTRARQRRRVVHMAWRVTTPSLPARNIGRAALTRRVATLRIVQRIAR